MTDKKKLSESLRPASFRGVAFQVDAADLSAGRRAQLHEYPQRDKPYVEDLGRATRDLSFTAFVVGEDYVEQANKLLGSLEEPGPGTLIHPWLGTLKVSLKDSARVSFDAALGVARFTLAFVESGELEFPSAEASTQTASRLAAAGLEEAAVESFADRFSVKGFQDFVSAAASGNLTALPGLISASQIGKAFGYASSLANSVTTAIAMISDPRALGWKIIGAFGLSGLSTLLPWGSLVRLLARARSSGKLSSPVAPTVYTPSGQQAYRNAVAVNALARQALLAQAVGASSLVGSKVDSLAVPVASHADLVAVRDELTAAIDQEALTADDGVYSSLMDARAAVWKDLTARARESARLSTLTPREVTPSLVLAYDYYEDAARDGEIVARNAIRHPGFVPVRPLKVLTG